MVYKHNHSPANLRVFTPAAAALGLQMPASTLRLYSVKFRSLLSRHARPERPPAGRSGRRRYTTEDMTVLARARDLVRNGRSFSEAVVEMGGTVPIDEQTVESNPPSENVAAASDQGDLVPKQVLAVAAEGWRALEVQHIAEIARLRREIDLLECELRDIRRPWWRQLFSRVKTGL